MSEFVQRSERSVKLPFGCKDLGELEEVRNWRGGALKTWPMIQVDQLAYLEGYLAGLFESFGGHVLVGISLFQGRSHLHLLPDSSLPAPVLFASWNGAAQEPAVRTALEEAGLEPATEPVGRWKAKRTLKYVLPGEASLAARLIGQVLRTGYGLGDLAEVRIWNHEPKTA
jgi:hypothetical protein